MNPKWLVEETGKTSWGRYAVIGCLVIIVFVVTTLVLDSNGLAPDWLRTAFVIAGMGLWAGFFLLVIIEGIRWLFRDGEDS